MSDTEDLPQGRDLGPVPIGPRRRMTSLAVQQSLAAIRRDRRRDRGWPDSTAEERERNLAAFVASLEDA